MKKILAGVILLFIVITPSYAKTIYTESELIDISKNNDMYIIIFEKELEALNENLSDMEDRRKEIEDKSGIISYSEYLIENRYEEKEMVIDINSKEKEISDYTVDKEILIKSHIKEYENKVDNYTLRKKEYDEVKIKLELELKKYNQGMISKIEYEDSKLMIKKLQIDLIKLENEMEILLSNIKKEIGIDLKEEVIIRSAEIEINELLKTYSEDEIYESLLENDNDYIDLCNEKLLNLEKIKYVKGYYGRDSEAYRNMEVELLENEYKISEKEVELFIESMEIKFNYENLKMQYEYKSDYIENERNKYELEKKKYEKGMISLYDLLDKYNELLEEEIAYNEDVLKLYKENLEISKYLK